MKQPKITVLMPVYNAEKYLRQSLESVLNQQYKDFEFLIVDDGSTDRSVEIIRGYNDNRIKLIKNRTNRGVIHSLNKGLGLAKGEYIARMDSDDVSLTNRLLTQVKYLDSNPDVSICGSWIKTLGANDTQIWDSPTDNDDIKAMLLFEAPIAHPSVMYRKSIKDNLLIYRKGFDHVEDYDLWVRLSDNYKFVNLDKVLLKYRVHKKQIGKRFRKLQVKNADKVRKLMLKKINTATNVQQMKIHSNIAAWKPVSTKQQLDEIKEWLDVLLAQNSQYKYFNQNSLKKVMTQRWIGICYLSKDLGLRRWIKCFSNKTFRPTMLAAIYNTYKKRLVRIFL